MKKSIAIIAARDNSHAQAVGLEFRRSGVEYVWLNTDNLETNETTILDGGLVVGNRLCTAVFCHNPRIDAKRQERNFVDDMDRQLYLSQWSQLLLNASSLSRITFFNRPRSGCSRSISRQQQIACSLGLRVPKTIYTNSLKQLRRCFDGVKDNIIIKPGNLELTTDAAGRILSNKVDLRSIDPDLLRNAPCFFQEYIPKKYELRVYVIGNNVLACRIDSQASPVSKDDWRRYDIARTPYVPVKLMRRVNVALAGIVSQLDLGYGAVDLIVTPDEEIVFLECNTNPSWLWVEKLTGLPITRTIAHSMMNEV